MAHSCSDYPCGSRSCFMESALCRSSCCRWYSDSRLVARLARTAGRRDGIIHAGDVRAERGTAARGWADHGRDDGRVFRGARGDLLWAVRRTRTPTDFFVAGRSVGTIVLGVAAMATTLSGFAMIGGPGLFYSMGATALFLVLPRR